jgi:hypothetical protein
MAIKAIGPEAVHSNVRRWPRCKIDVPVRAVVQKDDKTVIVPSRGRELNEGGLSVFIGFELPLNVTLEIEFTPVYSGEPVRFPCRVRNRSGYTYGLEFVSGTPDDHSRIQRVSTMLQSYGM